jgi:hypothetical protein
LPFSYNNTYLDTNIGTRKKNKKFRTLKKSSKPWWTRTISIPNFSSSTANWRIKWRLWKINGLRNKWFWGKEKIRKILREVAMRNWKISKINWKMIWSWGWKCKLKLKITRVNWKRKIKRLIFTKKKVVKLIV